MLTTCKVQYGKWLTTKVVAFQFVFENCFWLELSGPWNWQKKIFLTYPNKTSYSEVKFHSNSTMNFIENKPLCKFLFIITGKDTEHVAEWGIRWGSLSIQAVCVDIHSQIHRVEESAEKKSMFMYYKKNCYPHSSHTSMFVLSVGYS